jgi:hypothetical protein
MLANRSVNSPSRPPFRSIALLDCATTVSIGLGDNPGGGYTRRLLDLLAEKNASGATGSKPASLHFLTDSRVERRYGSECRIKPS